MHEIICLECKSKYMSRYSTTKFCSDKCRNKYRRKTFKYKLKCAHCNGDFESMKSHVKYCSEHCRKEVVEIRQLERLEEEEKIKRQKTIKKLSNALSNIVERYRVCANCGKGYVLTKNGTGYKYCNPKCKEGGYKKTRSKYKKKCRINREKRWSKNGKMDYSISLERLHNRDSGICHLCNRETNYNDYEITTEGHFIAGDNYPSIDHVIPIANGGLHRWNNVKLAHRRCNYIKSDNEIEFQLFLEI